VPDAHHDQGDPDLHRLFEEFDGRMVSPGGAASLLGVSRKTVHTLGKRGRLRVFSGPDLKHAKGLINEGPRWIFIPLEDVAAYAEAVGRPFPKGSWANP